MGLEVDGGLVLSALLATVIVGLLTYIFSKHFFTNTIPLDTTNQYVKLLKNLEIQISAINQLIDDAEDNQTTNLAPRLKQWVDDLKQVVYDAEDVRDVIATQTHENELSTTTTTPWNPFGRSLQEELNDVLHRMKCLLEQKDVFGLKPSTRSNSTTLETSMRLPTTSLVDQSGVYGRDDDKEKIKTLLLSNDGTSNVDVIAIVGMGGLGKTTLAQFLFNHYQIDSVFKPNKAWISVGEDFDVIKMTRIILEKLTSQSYATNDLDRLQTKLKETLSGKKFLIVLDDVWNENDANWDSLQKPFDFAAQGSKIIITTRSERVASITCATSTYKLKPLTDETCWLLFSKHAFKNIKLDSTFETLGKELVKKCGGLPLATKVLGGIVGTKLGHEEWNEVLKSGIWDLSSEANDKNILPVLRLSYHHLSSNLKRCFDFCALVPKDFHFEREKLVLLWMAENLMQDSKGKRRIDIGYEYLRDLESRSLIQPSIKGESYFGMHDLVNDLAKFVSGEFYKSFDLENSFDVGEKSRHFSYMERIDNFRHSTARFKVNIEAKRLKTFLFFSWRYIELPHLLCSEVLPQLNVLRSLTLAVAGIKQLPDSIGNLKLLRYLDLSKNLNLIRLPESLASLYKLEVLNLRQCVSLTKLPSKLMQLIKLNYLNIKFTKLQEMPLQMGRLKDLDVLTYFLVGKGNESSIRELKDLKYLRGGLSIRGLQNITHLEDALEANLKEKWRLEKLTLEWEDIDSDNSEDARIILENLRPPHLKLKKLYMKNYSGTRLPDWSEDHSFVNLASIKIMDFKNCLDLSPLGQLPSLKYLDIGRCDSLVTLIIPVELPNEIQHRIHVGHFSALVKLVIFWCPKLELPQQHHRFTSIEDFKLATASCSLQLFPLSLYPKLRNLNLSELKSIESLAVIDESNNLNLEYLESIEIWTCPKFEYLDAGKWCAPNMTRLWLFNCASLKILPENMCNIFQSLEELKLCYCVNLEALPQSGLPGNLSNLEIRGCKKLIANRSSWGLHKRLLSLSKFEIGFFECDDLESFPEEGLLPSSLSTLCIEGVPNLRNLNGKSFQLLTSLERLHLWNCPKLQCLPEQGLPTSLSTLTIRKCGMLESRCQRKQGEDWSKIAHIPSIHINYQTV